MRKARIFMSATVFAAAANALVPVAGAQAWTLKTLHSFCSETNCADGDRPLAALLRDRHGNLYGTTEFGGANNRGVVFELQPKKDGWKYTVLYSFCTKADCKDGAVIDAPLIMDVKGRLYGTSASGGRFNCGSVFRLSVSNGTWQPETLHDFCDKEGDGRWPGSGLAYQGQSSGALYDGLSPLYGTTRQGGSIGGGTVYSLVPGAKQRWRATVLNSFCTEPNCADGDEPLGDLLVDQSGALFGTASQGGPNGQGIAFRTALASGKWRTKILYAFCKSDGCPDGGTPVGPLVETTSGGIIGGALEPGDEGVLYQLVRDGKGWQETVLHTFCGVCEDGYDPMGGVVVDATGDLYGTAAFGGGINGIGDGVIFRISGGVYTPLYTFCSLQNCADGVFPQAPVTLGASGRIYGTTAGGLAEQRGSVFELSP